MAMDGKSFLTAKDKNKTEVHISAPVSLVPKIRGGLRSLTMLVKSSIRNLGITMDQALTLDQHVKCCFPDQKYCKT